VVAFLAVTKRDQDVVSDEELLPAGA
jgi:hypothetical protein